MKTEYTFEEMLAKESPESQRIIKERADKLREEYLLTKIRNDLNSSQTALASAIGISRPTVSKMEKLKQNLGILTLKKYVESLGGELSLQIKMPMGDYRTYTI